MPDRTDALSEQSMYKHKRSGGVHDPTSPTQQMHNRLYLYHYVTLYEHVGENFRTVVYTVEWYKTTIVTVSLETVNSSVVYT